MIDPPRLRELFMGLNDRITGYRVFAGDGAGGDGGGFFSADSETSWTKS